MDSITQAALGALCGELILSKRIGWKGAAWGLFFGTLPDLDIIAYAWQDATEQLHWHRGISHSLLIIPVAALLFGWLLSLVHKKKHVTFKEAAWFVFFAWATHVLIDCFNTYGTQIFEPFSDYRFSLNNIFIIDFFFLLPILIGLALANIPFRFQPRMRWLIGWMTAGWLCLYFTASLGMKLMAERQFRQRLNEWGVTPKQVMTAPTASNIFLWRMVAKDDEKYYVGYWSYFDEPERKYAFSEFEHGHHLEGDFKASEEYQTLKWFSRGWHKTYQVEGEPDSIYMAALMIGESRIRSGSTTEFRPAFIWKLTKNGEEYEMERVYKMSKDGWKHIANAVEPLYERVDGKQQSWMEGTWIWDLGVTEKTIETKVEAKK